MIIAIGSDHRGFKLKRALTEYLKEKGHKILDFGTFSNESCDYPIYCFKVAESVVRGEAQRGIFICKTGIGSSIALNKTKQIRAAVACNVKGAKFSRLHNDSNVLVLGSDFIKPDYAKKILTVWLRTEFEGGRHQRRLNQIKKFEDTA